MLEEREVHPPLGVASFVEVQHPEVLGAFAKDFMHKGHHMLPDAKTGTTERRQEAHKRSEEVEMLSREAQRRCDTPRRSEQERPKRPQRHVRKRHQHRRQER